VVVAVELLLAGFGSRVVAVTVAVLLATVPGGVPRGIELEIRNVATRPAAREDAVRLTVPLVPTGGVTIVNVGAPVSWSADAKWAKAGKGSVTVTVVASPPTAPTMRM
jgi:hypothetical protein